LIERLIHQENHTLLLFCTLSKWHDFVLFCLRNNRGLYSSWCRWTNDKNKKKTRFGNKIECHLTLLIILFYDIYIYALSRKILLFAIERENRINEQSYEKESNDSQQSRASRQAFNGNPEIDYSKQILDDEKKNLKYLYPRQ